MTRTEPLRDSHLVHMKIYAKVTKHTIKQEELNKKN